MRGDIFISAGVDEVSLGSCKWRGSLLSIGDLWDLGCLVLGWIFRFPLGGEGGEEEGVGVRGVILAYLCCPQ